jgi:hypothetical protein
VKILAVNDTVVSRFQSERVAESLRDVDLIPGCGDLYLWVLDFPRYLHAEGKDLVLPKRQPKISWME